MWMRGTTDVELVSVSLWCSPTPRDRGCAFANSLRTRYPRTRDPHSSPHRTSLKTLACFRTYPPAHTHTHTHKKRLSPPRSSLRGRHPLLLPLVLVSTPTALQEPLHARTQDTRSKPHPRRPLRVGVRLRDRGPKSERSLPPPPRRPPALALAGVCDSSAPAPCAPPRRRDVVVDAGSGSGVVSAVIAADEDDEVRGVLARCSVASGAGAGVRTGVTAVREAARRLAPWYGAIARPKPPPAPTRART